MILQLILSIKSFVVFIQVLIRFALLKWYFLKILLI